MIATPFWLLLRCWCSPKSPHHLLPPTRFLLDLTCPFLPSSPVDLGSSWLQLYLRTSPAAPNTGWLPKGLYFSNLAPTSSKSLLLPSVLDSKSDHAASKGTQANTSPGLPVPSESFISHLLWFGLHPSLRCRLSAPPWSSLPQGLREADNAFNTVSPEKSMPLA